MGTRKDTTGTVPAAHPEPQCNTGYAEPMPKTPRQAQIPGPAQDPDPEDGGLEHAPDPAP